MIPPYIIHTVPVTTRCIYWPVTSDRTSKLVILLDSVWWLMTRNYPPIQRL